MFILAFEENSILQELIAAALEDTGVQIHFLIDPQSLLQTQLPLLPELLLLSESDSPTLVSWCQFLKAHSVFQHLPLVVLTNAQSKLTNEEFHALGVTAILKKPFEASTFLQLIQNYGSLQHSDDPENAYQNALSDGLSSAKLEGLSLFGDVISPVYPVVEMIHPFDPSLENERFLQENVSPSDSTDLSEIPEIDFSEDLLESPYNRSDSDPSEETLPIEGLLESPYGDSEPDLSEDEIRSDGDETEDTGAKLTESFDFNEYGMFSLNSEPHSVPLEALIEMPSDLNTMIMQEDTLNENIVLASEKEEENSDSILDTISWMIHSEKSIESISEELALEENEEILFETDDDANGGDIALEVIVEESGDQDDIINGSVLEENEEILFEMDGCSNGEDIALEVITEEEDDQDPADLITEELIVEGTKEKIFGNENNEGEELEDYWEELHENIPDTTLLITTETNAMVSLLDQQWIGSIQMIPSEGSGLPEGPVLEDQQQESIIPDEILLKGWGALDSVLLIDQQVVGDLSTYGDDPVVPIIELTEENTAAAAELGEPMGSFLDPTDPLFVLEEDTAAAAELGEPMGSFLDPTDPLFVLEEDTAAAAELGEPLIFEEPRESEFSIESSLSVEGVFNQEWLPEGDPSSSDETFSLFFDTETPISKEGPVVKKPEEKPFLAPFPRLLPINAHKIEPITRDQLFEQDLTPFLLKTSPNASKSFPSVDQKSSSDSLEAENRIKETLDGILNEMDFNHFELGWDESFSASQKFESPILAEPMGLSSSIKTPQATTSLENKIAGLLRDSLEKQIPLIVQDVLEHLKQEKPSK